LFDFIVDKKQANEIGERGETLTKKFYCWKILCKNATAQFYKISILFFYKYLFSIFRDFSFCFGHF
jgi:hypothetical protein